MSIEVNKQLETADFPELDELLKDPEKAKEWALAWVNRDIEKEITIAGKAQKEGDYLDSMYALQQIKIMQERVQQDDAGAIHAMAQREWFEQARRAMALNKLVKFANQPAMLRRHLARRALQTIDVAF